MNDNKIVLKLFLEIWTASEKHCKNQESLAIRLVHECAHVELNYH